MKKYIFIFIFLTLGMPLSSSADDIDIYGVSSVSLPPNVLIIFDNSGSMDTEDVPGDPYDPNTTYSGSYETNAVYEYTRHCFWIWCWWTWDEITDDVDNVQCASVKNDLLTTGYSTGRMWTGSLTCRNGSSLYRIGNYRNYLESGGGANRRRLDVAKEVITDLVDDKGDELRFGVMIFNYSEGGHILQPIGTDKNTIINSINDLDAETWTPLAETLAEAGLYFAGKSSWFNSGVNYTSPMQERCQKNYIILMTDGEPTEDRNWRLETGTYIKGDTIGDYDSDGNETNIANRPDGYIKSSGDMDTSDYLDDVAKYLYENDLNDSLGTDGDFEKQNTQIFTIGFREDNQILQDTAANGGGEYYTASNAASLKEAFESIISQITTANAVFVAPVVPVSKLSSTYAGDRIYIGFFRPTEDGRWLGNIKKYGLGVDGEILDALGLPATDASGAIKETAISYWSTTADGPNVNEGGVGEMLKNQASRSIYTYTGSYSGGSMGGTASALTDFDNAFLYSNTLITNADLDVSTDAERQDVIDDIYGASRDWILGDFIHSKPAMVHYSTKSVIYAGNNGGTLHAIDDDDGTEIWAFIPPDQLNKLKLLSDANADHDYFVDAAPSIYDGFGQKILIIGERRGGNYYHAIDISAYDSPEWLYDVGPGHLGGSETLGQSWVSPEIAVIQTGPNPEDKADVFLMAGGYDTNQDLETPAAADSIGRAVFAIKVTDGSVSSFNFNANNFPDMTHCIVEVTGLDNDEDGIVNRIYAGDLGGKMFIFRDDIDDGTVDGTWTAARLFNASADGVQRKIFYAPDYVKEEYGEYIFFGTGNREDPRETDVENRMYAIKNNWAETDLEEADLIDVTDNLIQLGTTEEKSAVQSELDNGKGWYIRLEEPGEKVVSSPLVFGGVVYFTTYTPDPDGGLIDPSDPCKGSTDRGTARLYAVNYKTGGGIYDWNATPETDGEGGTVTVGKQDRSRVIGTSIPSAPVIAILETGPKMYVGIEGGVETEDLLPMPGLSLYYWRQIMGP